MQRKYISEFGMHVYVSHKRILPIEGLASLKSDAKDCHNYHLYFLLSYPRLYFDFDNCFVGKDGIHLKIFEATPEKVSYVLPPFKPFPEMNISDFRLESKYPHNSITIIVNPTIFKLIKTNG